MGHKLSLRGGLGMTANYTHTRPETREEQVEQAIPAVAEAAGLRSGTARPGVRSSGRGRCVLPLPRPLQDELLRHALGHQLAAGNKTARERLQKELKLPAKITQDDFGFGLVRADGKSPRPAYDCLKKADPNAAILKQKERAVDVEAFVLDGMVPLGYQYDDAWRQPWVVIKGVTVGTPEPTVVKLRPAKKP